MRSAFNREEIHEAGEAIYALKPVSFRYHKQYDATQTMAFGLIAEEVREVNSDLLGTQSRMTAPIYSLRTNQRDVPNEFLKEHRRGEEQDCKIQEQETAVAEPKSEIRNLAAILNEQATELRKVGAQLQISNAAAQAVAKNP